MKTLTTQSWEIVNEDNETTKIDFEKFKSGRVTLSIYKERQCVTFEEEEIKELKNILESTKFIFNQTK